MAKKSDSGPMVGVEKELDGAIDRLLAGKPLNKELAHKAKIGKTLKVNSTTVAQEAGRARTLIAHETCAYPRIRARIEALKTKPQDVTTFAQLNRNLRTGNLELKKAVKVAASSMAAMIVRMNRVEKASKRQIADALRRERAKLRPADSEHIAGASLLETGSVIQFPRATSEKTDGC